MNWEGCNPNAELIVSEASEGYYTFGEKGYENVKAKGYKRLLYKDIYPNIDIEYTIPDKGGIKYKIILHPNADPSLIKMHYTGAIEEIKKDKDGNIIIETPAGDITDHAPESYYENSKQALNSSFKISKSTVSFQLQTSNSTLQNLIIDPWTTTPTSMQTNNLALDIDYDKYGNVFFSGGTYPFKLSKYSSSGTFLWTFTNPSNWALGAYYYSKFCVLTNTGTTFIGEACGLMDSGTRVMKINNNGTLNYTSPYFGMNNETWRMLYNNFSKRLIAFGGGTQYSDNIKVIADTNLSGSIFNSFDGITSSFNDIASAVIDNNGDFYALMTSGINGSGQEGHLKKSLLSTNYSPPCAFDVQTNYLFQEAFMSGFPDANTIVTVRANALALNGCYIYSYDGKTLKAWNKTDGSLLSSLIVNNSYIGGLHRTHEGIDVDYCNNVYVGGANKVHVYTFTGNSFNTLTPITSNISGEVHDLKLNKLSSELYVCGNGFVTNTIAPISCDIPPIVLNFTADSCLGNACVFATGGIPPYSYHWSNGSTSSCITNVLNGVYTVTVSDNSCAYNSNTDTVLVNRFIHLSVTPVNPMICKGDTITLVASSTSSGVTYQWNNGIIGDSISVSPTVTTNYPVIATRNLCTDSISVKVIVNPTYTINKYKTICQGSSFTLPNGLIVNTSGIYVDTLTSYFGCDSIITTNLTVNPIKQTNLNPVICQGEIFQIGIHTYTTNGIYNDTLTTYFGCDSIVTTNLTVIPSYNIIINKTICQGQIYQVGIHNYTTTGIYKDTLTTLKYGCDSIITTNLFVDPVKYTTLSPLICEGEIYQVGIHNYTMAGNYIDTLTTYLGCDSIVTINLTTVPPPTINLGNDTTLCYDQSLLLDVTSQYATYHWQDNSIYPTYNIIKEGIYWVKVSIDSNCFASDTINIIYQDCINQGIYIPNSFTPNGDGLNDVFNIKTIIEFSQFKLCIYDRWGEMLFESDDINKGWDGSYKGKPVPNDVYVYLFNVRIKDTNFEKKISGRVTVVR